MKDFQIAVLSTGGTIEKTYDPFDGALSNKFSVLDRMLGKLQLPGTRVVRVPLMNKDSLEMTEADHDLIATTAQAMAKAYDAVVVVHGTDRLNVSGERTYAENPTPRVPIIFTGAMRPYELRDTDSVQNMTEAFLAAKILTPGVWCVMHNTALAFPGVVKNRETMSFQRIAPA